MLIGLLLSFGLLLIAMTVHEFAHGYVAYRLGDTTAQRSGRLTLNPLAHIDPVGTVLLPLFLYIVTRGQFVFGAAKPVPINYWALRNPRRDIIWIGLSGPCANFLLAIACGFLLRFLPGIEITNYLLGHMVVINIVLGLFNLVPVPPLDGSRVLMGLLPQEAADKYAQIEPYGFYIVMAMVAFGVFDLFVWPIARLLTGLILYGG